MLRRAQQALRTAGSRLNAVMGAAPEAPVAILVAQRIAAQPVVASQQQLPLPVQVVGRIDRQGNVTESKVRIDVRQRPAASP